MCSRIRPALTLGGLALVTCLAGCASPAGVDAIEVPIGRVELGLAQPGLISGEPNQLTVRAFDPDGARLPGSSLPRAQWDSDDYQVADVNDSGQVVGRRAGTTTVRIRLGTASAALEVSVTPGAPVTTRLEWSPRQPVVGDTIRVTASRFDASGNRTTSFFFVRCSCPNGEGPVGNFRFGLPTSSLITREPGIVTFEAIAQQFWGEKALPALDQATVSVTGP